jgi:hypothetical protein
MSTNPLMLPISSDALRVDDDGGIRNAGSAFSSWRRIRDLNPEGGFSASLRNKDDSHHT